MEDEKLIPPVEPTPQITPNPDMWVRRKPEEAAPPVFTPLPVSNYTPPAVPAPEPVVPPVFIPSTVPSYTPPVISAPEPVAPPVIVSSPPPVEPVAPPPTSEEVGAPIKSVGVAIEKPAPEEENTPASPAAMPSPKAQQWGVVISIVIIVLMIIIGAFYSWGKRIAQEQALTESAITQ